MADMPETEPKPTPEQEAACERAISYLEGKADAWAASFDLPAMVKNITYVTRELRANAPPDVREHFIGRQEAQIDAIVRQAFIEGALRACMGEFDDVRISKA